MDFFPKVLWTMLLNLINFCKMTKIHHQKNKNQWSKVFERQAQKLGQKSKVMRWNVE
jgi:hypothetical protein